MGFAMDEQRLKTDGEGACTHRLSTFLVAWWRGGVYHWTVQDPSCPSLGAGQPSGSHRSPTDERVQRGQLV
jgi:hypothetical protein